MREKRNLRHIFLVGAKSLGAYGGYETFVNKLTEYHQNDSRLKYHVACKANGQGAVDEANLSGVSEKVYKNGGKDVDSDNGKVVGFTYHNAQCFKIHVPENLGAAQAIYYDCKALSECIRIIGQEKINDAIVYVMACRIGPFFSHYVRKIHKLGGKIYINPDGHEWKRAKWSKVIRAYWKKSEDQMVKKSDLIICDSVNIEKYIQSTYSSYHPKTIFIAYGAETRKSKLKDDNKKMLGWYEKHGLKVDEYYLVVGRFVPENNYETMIREFMKSNSKKKFAIITNVNEAFLNELENKLGYKKDNRIKFVGTVYDQELLMKIRENAYGYFHGHEVGGTNPSLLEALGCTKINLLLNVGFNKEVALDTALYWSKKDGDLASLIDDADNMNEDERNKLGAKAKQRIMTAYSWEFICDRYSEEFLK